MQGAPKGNKFAEKWTEENVTKILKKMKRKAIEDKVPFIGIIFRDMGYYRELWHYWKTKFKENEKVFNLIKNIEGIIEANLVESGLYGDTNNTMSIFVLKAHHNWKDKHFIDMDAKVDNEVKIPDDQLLKLVPEIEEHIKNNG